MPKGCQCGSEWGAAPTTPSRLGNAVSARHRPRLVSAYSDNTYACLRHTTLIWQPQKKGKVCWLSWAWVIWRPPICLNDTPISLSNNYLVHNQGEISEARLPAIWLSPLVSKKEDNSFSSASSYSAHLMTWNLRKSDNLFDQKATGSFHVFFNFPNLS